jgi:hypothetical protein
VGVLVVLVHDFDFFQLQSKVAWRAILDKVLQDYGPTIQALGEFTTLVISFSSIKYISQYDRISDSCFFLWNDFIDSKIISFLYWWRMNTCTKYISVLLQLARNQHSCLSKSLQKQLIGMWWNGALVLAALHVRIAIRSHKKNLIR